MGGTLGVKLWKSFLVGGEMCLAHAVAGNQRLPSQDLAGHEGTMGGQVRTHSTDVTVFVLSSSQCTSAYPGRCQSTIDSHKI